ncbi:MAG: hypothetical protein LZ161_06110 [Thaumarchaeota archaeon]|nr:hypothetical protein [Candidatus Terraquivivens yellowstonensis]
MKVKGCFTNRSMRKKLLCFSVCSARFLSSALLATTKPAEEAASLQENSVAYPEGPPDVYQEPSRKTGDQLLQRPAQEEATKCT